MRPRKVVVHGHTPVSEPEIGNTRINIDTGAFATVKLRRIGASPSDNLLSYRLRQFVARARQRPDFPTDRQLAGRVSTATLVREMIGSSMDLVGTGGHKPLLKQRIAILRPVWWNERSQAWVVVAKVAPR
jgi:hypothetical protein